MRSIVFLYLLLAPDPGCILHISLNHLYGLLQYITAYDHVDRLSVARLNTQKANSFFQSIFLLALIWKCARVELQHVHDLVHLLPRATTLPAVGGAGATLTAHGGALVAARQEAFAAPSHGTVRTRGERVQQFWHSKYTVDDGPHISARPHLSAATRQASTSGARPTVIIAALRRVPPQ